MFKNLTGFPAANGSLWGDPMNNALGALSSHMGLNVISEVFPFDFDSGYGVDGDAQLSLLTGEYACKNDGVWVLYSARAGVIAYRASPAKLYANTGSAWVEAVAGGGGGGGGDTIYTADGTIADARTITLANGLTFASSTVHPATRANVVFNLNHTDDTGANLSSQFTLADASPSFASYYTYSGVTRYKEDSANINASSCIWVTRVGQSNLTHSCIVGLDAIGGNGAHLGLDSLGGFTGVKTPDPTKTVLTGENGVYKGAEYADGDAYSVLFTDNSLINLGYADATYLKIADATSTPAGSVSAFAGSVAPSGWLFCDGSDIDRTIYAALFAAIGTDYGVGDGSTTFNIPDLRGEFIRGFDAGRGVDTGRVLGSSQADELKAHTHSGTTIGTLGTGLIEEGQSDPNYSTGSIGSTGGTETRPRNIAMNYMIKA